MSEKSTRNKTIKIEDLNKDLYEKEILEDISDFNSIINKTICWDSLQLLKKIPNESVDLIFADPPYNLTKIYALVLQATKNMKHG